MRTLKSLFCALSLSALFMVSCGNENEPTNPGSGGGIVPPVQTDPSKLVTSILRMGERDESIYDFTYDSDNRLTRFDYKETYYGHYNSYFFDISYSPLKIVLVNDEYTSEFLEINLNKDGYMIYGKFDDSGIYIEYMFEYNDGYLVKSSKKSQGIWYEVVYTWENGNLIKIQEDYERLDEGTAGSYLYNFTYSEKSSINTGIYFPNWHNEEYFMLVGGFLGKTTAQVPVSVEVKNLKSGDIEKTNISVEYDNKGRIIKYFENETLERVYAYEGNKAVWPEN